MNKEEWRKEIDVSLMIPSILDRGDRKLRLFAVACCREYWDRLKNKHKKAVEVAEKYADGLCSVEELREQHRKMESANSTGLFFALEELTYNRRILLSDCTRSIASDMTGLYWIRNWITEEAAARHSEENERTEAAFVRARRKQSLIIKDIYRHPLAASETADPQWLQWNDKTVLHLAESMYDTREFLYMPILADALEESGCVDQEILEHCRKPQEHWKGCWVVDLLLGKSWHRPKTKVKKKRTWGVSDDEFDQAYEDYQLEKLDSEG